MRILKYFLIMLAIYAAGLFAISRMSWGEVCSIGATITVIVVFVLSWINEWTITTIKKKLPSVPRSALHILNMSILGLLYTIGAIYLLIYTGKPIFAFLLMAYGLYDAYTVAKKIESDV